MQDRGKRLGARDRGKQSPALEETRLTHCCATISSASHGSICGLALQYDVLLVCSAGIDGLLLCGGGLERDALLLGGAPDGVRVRGTHARTVGCSRLLLEQLAAVVADIVGATSPTGSRASIVADVGASG